MSPGMGSTVPRAAAKVIERASEISSLDAIAERTQTVLDAGRFQPRDEEGLERLARKYYFSMALPASYYPKNHDDRWTEWAVEQGTSRAYIAMLDGAAVGVQPSMAVRQIHVINGVPTMSADLMFGRMLATGLLRRDDFSIVASKTECALTIGTMTRKPEHRLVVTCKIEDFKHLVGKDNWRNHPEDMLVARAKSRSVRRHAPDLLVGVYSTEEMQDAREGATAGVYEVPAEFMPPIGTQEPTAPPVATATVAEAAQGASVAAPTVNVSQFQQELNALGLRIKDANDSITPEEVEKLRGDVEAVSAVSSIAYGVLVKKWAANEFLGPYVVTS